MDRGFHRRRGGPDAEAERDARREPARRPTDTGRLAQAADMTDERDIILSSRPFASETRWLSWWHLGSTLAILAALFTTILVFDWWLVRLPVSVLAGLVMVRVFICYHDFEHGTILHGSRLAKVLLHGYGLLVLNPPSIWSRSHGHHHRNVGRVFGASIGSYPLMTRAGYADCSRGEQRAYALSRNPAVIAAGYLTIFLYGMCWRSFVTNPRAHADSGIAIALHLALVATLAVFAPALLLFVVVVPITVACALGAYLFYAQHNFPSVEVLTRENWSYCAAALRNSSYIRMGRLGHWFTGNIGYHHVHHLNARIPFYRLPEAMAGIPALQSPGVTSLGVRDVWRCLQLKLWDPELQRMVGFGDVR
jgi:omega-6 fatty acid desaturase (delta-12 desaturase)